MGNEQSMVLDTFKTHLFLAGLTFVGFAAAASGQVLVEGFEFASDTASAQAGVTITYGGETMSATVASGSGANATGGNYSLALTIAQSAPAAFDNVRVNRSLATPFIPAATITADNAGSLAVSIDIKGEAGLDDANIFVNLRDDEGQEWRFINFNEPALGRDTFTTAVRLAFFDVRDVGSGVLGTVRDIQIRIQNPNATTINGTVYLDNLVFTQPDTGGPVNGTVQWQPHASAFPNPERGFYRVGPSNGSLAHGSPNYSGYRSGNVTLTYSRIDLANFRTSPISQSYLNDLSAGFDRLRAAGIKGVLRVVYNNGYAPDAPIEYVRLHLEQLAPLFEEHQDVIAFVKAGIIGAWGEWHSTTNHHDPSDEYEQFNLPWPPARQAVVDALLENFPTGLSIQLRRPWWKVPWDEAESLFPGQQLTAETAFDGSDLARVGFHNDCFLASSSDYGTYRGRTLEQEKDFMAEDTQYVPMGGETCNPDMDYINCANAISELERFHYTYLNINYHPQVIQHWRDAGCFDEIERRMGYRFVLLDGEFPDSITPGVPFQWSFRLQNEGFAPLYNERPVYLRVLEGGNVVEEIELPELDPRHWLPGTHQFQLETTLSVEPEGEAVTLALWLPDRSESLHDRPEYSVRFANAGTWNAARGDQTLVTGMTVAPESQPTGGADLWQVR